MNECHADDSVGNYINIKPPNILILFIYLFDLWFMFVVDVCIKFLYAAPSGRSLVLCHFNKTFKFTKLKSELIILNVWIQICLLGMVFFTLFSFMSTNTMIATMNRQNHPESQTVCWRQIISEIWDLNKNREEQMKRKTIRKIMFHLRRLVSVWMCLRCFVCEMFVLLGV